MAQLIKPALGGGSESSCLICLDPLKTPRRSVKIPPEFGRTSSDAFLKICGVFKVSFLEIQQDWQFGSDDTLNSLPFCLLCVTGFQAVIKLQNQLVEIQKKTEVKIDELRGKIRESSNIVVLGGNLKAVNFRTKVLAQGFSQNATGTSQNLPTYQSPPATLPPQRYSTWSSPQTVFPNTGSVSNFNNCITVTAPHQEAVTPGINVYYTADAKLEIPTAAPEYPPSYPPSDPDPGIPPGISDDEGPNNSGFSDNDNDSEEDNYINPSPPKRSRAASSTPRQPRTSLKRDRQAEYFAPIVTDSAGRMTFEGVVITPSEKGYKCGACDATVGKDHGSISLRKAKIHIKGFHLGAYKCPICQKNMTSQDILSQHLTRFHEQRELPCPDCGKPIKERNMKHHQFIHMNAAEQAAAIAGGFKRQVFKGLGQLPCRVCGKNYPTPSKLRRHELVHVSSKFRKDFKCPHCPKAYTTEQGRKEHVVSVHESLNARRKLCKVCGESVIRRDFRKHLAYHDILTCKNCEKTFVSERNHRAHESSCGVPRKKKEDYEWECDICNKFFPSKGYMRKHRRHVHKTHWKLKVPLKLLKDVTVDNPREECLDDLNNEGIQHVDGEVYAYQLYNLEKMGGDGGEVMGYRCVTCLEEIVEEDEDVLEEKVKTHVRTRHIGSFRCNWCSKRMKTLCDVETHQRREHLQLQGFDCDFCGRKGVPRQTFKKHLWRHRNVWEVAEAVNEGETLPKDFSTAETISALKEMGVEVRFECGLCDQSGFGSPEDLFRHRGEEHPEAKVKRVPRLKEPKKRGRKPRGEGGSDKWATRKRGKGKKTARRVKVIAEEDSEEEEAMDFLEEVVIKEEVESMEEIEEESEEEYKEARKSVKRMKTEGVEGGRRRSLRTPARVKKNYAETSEEEEEEVNKQIKKSPHSSAAEDWSSD